MKKIIIITLNYNQNEYTLKCIESILKSDFENYQLLLIDNGSTAQNYHNLLSELPDSDKLLVERLDKNQGYVGGINHGLAMAMNLNPNYFLIMNNDTIIDSSAINELLKVSTLYSDLAIVTGKVYEYDEPDRLQDIGYSFINRNYLIISRVGMNETDFGQFNEIQERDMIDDIFWLFPSKLYKEIGGYSNYFWFNSEQADFALRAKNKGYKLIYVPLAKLWHKGSISIGGRDLNPKLAYWTVQSSLILRYLHLSKKYFISYYMIKVESILRTYLKSVFLFVFKKTNQFEYANAKFRGLMYFNKWIFKKNVNTGRNPYIKD